MKTQSPPTLEELNRVQKLWMETEYDSPKAKEVCELYGRVSPKSYLSLTRDRTKGAPIIDNMPIWTEARPIKEAIDYAKAAGIRTDVAWCVWEWVAL